jgi:peptidoglycan/LPS O-acetylase OafA/YrhL
MHATEKGVVKGLSAETKVEDIQVLRGVAIAMVLLYHLSLSAILLDVFPVKVTSPLYLGVDIFFVVSGFVITRSLMRDSFHALRFFIKRVFRLLPALLCFIGITLLLNRYVQQSDLPADSKSMFSVSNDEFRHQARSIAFGYYTLIEHGSSFANGAMWSLSVEDQFYAAVVLLCLVLAFVFGRRQQLIGAFLCIAAAGAYLCLVGTRLISCGHCATDGLVVLRYLTHWRFDFLALGVAIAFLDARVARRIRAKFHQTGPFCAALLLTFPVMLAAVCESPLSGGNYYLHGFGLAAIGLCFAGLVLLAGNGLAFPPSRGWIYRSLRVVGDRSYTYYLFHFPMFIVAWLFFNRWFPYAFKSAWHYSVAQAITVAAVLVPLAEIVYRGVELPLAELGRKIASKMRTRGSNASEDDSDGYRSRIHLQGSDVSDQLGAHGALPADRKAVSHRDAA